MNFFGKIYRTWKFSGICRSFSRKKPLAIYCRSFLLLEFLQRFLFHGLLISVFTSTKIVRINRNFLKSLKKNEYIRIIRSNITWHKFQTNSVNFRLVLYSAWRFSVFILLSISFNKLFQKRYLLCIYLRSFFNVIHNQF